MSMIEPITYSNQGPWVKRAFISTLEYMTGRLSLERAYKAVIMQYESNPDRPFFDHAIDALNIEIDYPLNTPQDIPDDCPLIVVANHPFGILDGLLINHILHQKRKHYKILTNEVLTKAKPMLPWLIAIDDSKSSEGTRKNNRAIREAMEMLRDGQCIIIFPAGRLARPNKWGEHCTDWEWQPLVGHLVLKTKSKNHKPLMILPIFFEGQNSRIFRLAALLKFFTITRSLVIYELMNKRKSNVKIRIGRPFPASEYSGEDAETVTKDLRQKTLSLGERV